MEKTMYGVWFYGDGGCEYPELCYQGGATFLANNPTEAEEYKKYLKEWNPNATYAVCKIVIPTQGD